MSLFCWLWPAFLPLMGVSWSHDLGFSLSLGSIMDVIELKTWNFLEQQILRRIWFLSHQMGLQLLSRPVIDAVVQFYCAGSLTWNFSLCYLLGSQHPCVTETLGEWFSSSCHPTQHILSLNLRKWRHLLQRVGAWEKSKWERFGLRAHLTLILEHKTCCEFSQLPTNSVCFSADTRTQIENEEKLWLGHVFEECLGLYKLDPNGPGYIGADVTKVSFSLPLGTTCATAFLSLTQPELSACLQISLKNLDLRGPSHKYPSNGLKVAFCCPKTSCMK